MLLNLTDLSPEPLHQQISAQLAHRIAGGRLKGGWRLPPIPVLARRHRVSRRTVERAYLDLVRRGLIEPSTEGSYRVALLAEGALWTPSPAERLDDDLRLACELQRHLLPRAGEIPAEVELAAHTAPSRGVGGDLYDYFVFDHSHLGLVIADASGSGLRAALIMSQLQAVLRTGVKYSHPLQQTLADLNGHLEKNTSSRDFATLFYGIYDRRSGLFEYVNAGHDYPLLVRGDGSHTWLESTGPPLGIFPDYEARCESVRLRPGDGVCCYTDGITEAADPEGRRFGEERLMDLVIAHRRMSAPDIVDVIRRNVAEFCRSGPIPDDRTLMAFKVISLSREASHAA